MKPYGLPRVRDIEFPDVADIQKYGLKGSAGRCFKENGEYKSYIRNSRHRKQIRRKWKRKARMDVQYTEEEMKEAVSESDWEKANNVPEEDLVDEH